MSCAKRATKRAITITNKIFVRVFITYVIKFGTKVVNYYLQNKNNDANNAKNVNSARNTDNARNVRNTKNTDN